MPAAGLGYGQTEQLGFIDLDRGSFRIIGRGGEFGRTEFHGHRNLHGVGTALRGSGRGVAVQRDFELGRRIVRVVAHVEGIRCFARAPFCFTGRCRMSVGINIRNGGPGRGDCGNRVRLGYGTGVGFLSGCGPRPAGSVGFDRRLSSTFFGWAVVVRFTPASLTAPAAPSAAAALAVAAFAPIGVGPFFVRRLGILASV